MHRKAISYDVIERWTTQMMPLVEGDILLSWLLSMMIVHCGEMAYRGGSYDLNLPPTPKR
jgi:hypothetical protein